MKWIAPTLAALALVIVGGSVVHSKELSDHTAKVQSQTQEIVAAQGDLRDQNAKSAASLVSDQDALKTLSDTVAARPRLVASVAAYQAAEASASGKADATDEHNRVIAAQTSARSANSADAVNAAANEVDAATASVNDKVRAADEQASALAAQQAAEASASQSTRSSRESSSDDSGSSSGGSGGGGGAPDEQSAPSGGGGPDLTLYVVGYGGQPEIDACIGAIDFAGLKHFAEHNYCGGGRYFSLGIGSTVQTYGADNALYRVFDIYDKPTGSYDYDTVNPQLQTSLGHGMVRLWIMQRIG